MKKKGVFLVIFLQIFIFLMVGVSACTLNANLLNQDPYPAMPGESVKIVLQVTGVENINCGEVRIKIHEDFPFKVDPSTPSERTIQAGVYIRDYPNFWLVPVILRVDKDSKEGDNKLEVVLSRTKGTTGVNGTSGIVYNFDVNVKDVRTDFEVSVKNYNPATKKITFEVLNKGKNNIEALSVELKKQDNVILRGSSINTVGSLDSKDFTTAEFEANVERGEIELTLYYTDIIGVRRSTDKTLYFDPQPFILRANADGKVSTTTYVIIVVVVLVVVYLIYRRYKKKQTKHRLLHHK